MLRTIFEAECALSSTEGILGKEQPLEVLKTSVLNHIPTGWTLCVRAWACVCACACACTPPLRDFTINHILCDFACPVLPFMSVLMPFLCLCNGEVTFENHSYGLRNWQLMSVCSSCQCFLINQTNAVILGWQLYSLFDNAEGVSARHFTVCVSKSTSAVGKSMLHGVYTNTEVELKQLRVNRVSRNKKAQMEMR